jgi:hypothetical protein
MLNVECFPFGFWNLDLESWTLGFLTPPPPVFAFPISRFPLFLMFNISMFIPATLSTELKFDSFLGKGFGGCETFPGEIDKLKDM